VGQGLGVRAIGGVAEVDRHVEELVELRGVARHGDGVLSVRHREVESLLRALGSLADVGGERRVDAARHREEDVRREGVQRRHGTEAAVDGVATGARPLGLVGLQLGDVRAEFLDGVDLGDGGPSSGFGGLGLGRGVLLISHLGFSVKGFSEQDATATRSRSEIVCGRRHHTPSTFHPQAIRNVFGTGQVPVSLNEDSPTVLPAGLPVQWFVSVFLLTCFLNASVWAAEAKPSPPSQVLLSLPWRLVSIFFSPKREQVTHVALEVYLIVTDEFSLQMSVCLSVAFETLRLLD